MVAGNLWPYSLGLMPPMPRHLPQPIVVLFVSLLFLNACTAAPMLPPELHDEEADWGPRLALFDEPPLWPPAATDGYQRRLRLFLFPPRAQNIAIRIDTNSSGQTTGRMILVQLRRVGRGWDIVQDRTFSVSPDHLAVLDDLIAQSKLWQIYPEHWVNNNVCIDGVEIVMERVEQRQYRFSEANAQCTAPESMLRVAAKIIDLAGMGTSDVAGWLH